MASLDNAITAALSGTISNTIVYPLDVAKAQIQTSVSKINTSPAKENKSGTPISEDKTESIIKCLIRIYKEEGIKGLYKGYSFSIGSGIIQTFSYWLVYTIIRKKYYVLFHQKRKNNGVNKKLSSWEELLINITSASVSNFITTPISIISTSQKTTPSKSLKEHVMKIYNKNRNILDFYKGLKISLLLTCNPAITYTTFKKLQHIILHSFPQAALVDLSKHDFSIDDTTVTLSPNINLLCGMTSKVVATLITFPLILSKVNLQNPNGDIVYKNVIDVLIQLYQRYGIQGWYKGIVIQLVKNTLNQGINSMVKGELGKLVLKLRKISKN